MRKRFVVITDRTTAAQDEAFIKWLASKFDWWHWLSEGWLLVDPTGQYFSEKIRKAATQCFPNINLVVIEVPRSTTNDWAGFGPIGSTDETNMFNWMNKNWL